MENITGIITLILELAVAAASIFLIPWLKSKLSDNKLSEILLWVEIAVSAAEQLYSSSQGKEKKAFVVKFLEEHGYTVDSDELDAIVESTVLRLHNELRH